MIQYSQTINGNVQDLRLKGMPEVGEAGSCVIASSPPSKPKDSKRSRAVTPPSGASN